MDRRRFKPTAPDGLEGRALMSLFGGKTAYSNFAISVQDLPENFQQKEQRIAHLSYYLEQTQPGRFLNAGTMKQLQAELLSVAGNLTNPPSTVIKGFNNALRHAYPYQTLSPANAANLNHAFGSVLVHAGATTGQTDALKSLMNSIAFVDSKSIQPGFLAANDYSLVLQMTLAVGRPIKTPTLAGLASNSGVKAKDNLSGVTYSTTPTLNGIYDAGKSNDAFTMMQILDGNGQVVGSGVVDSTGQYVAQVTVPLSEGIHKLRTRAVDIQGHFSAPSQGAFRLKVAPKPGRTAAATTTGQIFSPTSTMTVTTSAASTTATTTPSSQTPTSPVGGPFSIL